MENTKRGGERKGLFNSLKFKLVGVSTLPILISVIGLTLFFIQRQKSQLKAQLLNRGETVAGLLAYNSRYGVQIGDKPILDKILGGVQGDPDVVYTLICDAGGAAIASFNAEGADLGKIKPAMAVTGKAVIEYGNVLAIAMPVELVSEAAKDEGGEAEDELFDGSLSPSKKDAAAGGPQKRVIGSVLVGISLDNMKKAIAASIAQTLFFSVIIFAAALALAFWIGSVIAAPIKRVVGLLNDISQGEGDLSQRIHLKSTDETGDLAKGFNTFLDKFQEIKKISVFLNDLADGGGDLTKRLGIDSQDEVGMLAKGFDRFTDKLHDIIAQVAQNTEKIAQASQTVSDTSVRLARELGEVAGQSREVAQSTAQITRTIERTSENVTNVDGLMNTAEKVSSSGVEVVDETKRGMTQIAATVRASSEVVAKLNDSTRNIGDSIRNITEIADQTKLIAINAAIEASRVGAQGKGFAVVAEEIRRLAARVTKTTQEISGQIRAIQEESSAVVAAMKKGMDEVARGLSLSEKSSSALKDISQSVRDSKGRMGQIAIASNEQTSTISVISKNIAAISNSARQSSEGVTQAAQSMQALNKEVQALQQLVGQFVLDR